MGGTPFHVFMVFLFPIDFLTHMVQTSFSPTEAYPFWGGLAGKVKETPTDKNYF